MVGVVLAGAHRDQLPPVAARGLWRAEADHAAPADPDLRAGRPPRRTAAGALRLVSFIEDGAPELGALDPTGRLVCGLGRAAEARGADHAAKFGRALPFLQAGPAAMDQARELVEWAFREQPERVVRSLADLRLASPVPRPTSVRDSMSFERHIIQATRRAALGPLGRLDDLLERRVGPRRSLAGRLNRAFYERPLYYKSNPRSVVGPDAEVRMPPYTKRFDYELEWGIFIGTRGRRHRASARPRPHRRLRRVQRLLGAGHPDGRDAEAGSGPRRARTSTPATRSAPGS